MAKREAVLHLSVCGQNPCMLSLRELMEWG